MGSVVAALAEHAFEHLFIERLGWDRLRSATAVTRHDATLHLTTVTQKRGFTVFHCPAPGRSWPIVPSYAMCSDRSAVPTTSTS